jgi:peptidoglycan/xylan/chitin deacetylase (PgdA/CDA1 family)
MPADVLRTRFQLLKESNCAVLPLDEAVKRMYANDLPDRAVAITFDDGTSDFYRRAFPVIHEFGFPVTLYLTTFYTHYNRPVFDLMLSYLLWKGRNEVLDLRAITGGKSGIDLRDHASQEKALAEIATFAKARQLSAEEKDALLASLASQLRVDYDALNDQRIMHNVTPDEVRMLAAAGIDVQLHTHRHRTPMDRRLFVKEINDNRESIQEMTGKHAEHFCYPSGVYNLAFLPWLQESGVVSATTCETGFASRSSNPLLLPRMLDNPQLSSIEFESWLTGVSAALPRRRKGKEIAA